MVPRHKQPGRAEMMKGYRHKSKQKIQFLVQELKRKLEATGSVSTTSGMKSVLHSAISLCSSYAGENGAHKYTLNSEVTVESPLVMPPAAVATQTPGLSYGENRGSTLDPHGITFYDNCAYNDSACSRVVIRAPFAGDLAR